jgi:hypothetical protein
MIYIQSDKDRTLPYHFDSACALYGAIENPQSFRLTSFEEVKSGKFDSLIKTNLFVGSVEFMTEVFNRIGYPTIKLPSNSNRELTFITLGEAKSIASKGTKIFIKPIQNKLFTGFVLDEYQYSSIANIPDDTIIMAYDVFDHVIDSEWRCYIHNNKIIDSRNYSGDFKISPDYGYVNDVLKSNKDSFPCAYTIDIGILSNHTNVVIEFNDMWAIGNYGIPNDEYVRLLRDRYFEIIQNKK